MTRAQLTATSPLEMWLSYIESSHSKAIDMGLTRVKAVASELDLLTPAPYVITVGGTNGKGTTCRLLELILLNAGLNVGVFSSPHLIDYNERVRINDAVLPDSAHSAAFAFIDSHKSHSLSYFEFSTLGALYLFKQAQLDVVILEVGLGGRLDATNIIDADICAITSIDIDHVDYLGDTREQIGFEKAGIMRAGKSAVIGEQDIPITVLAHANSLPCHVLRNGVEWHYQRQGDMWTFVGQKVRFDQLPVPAMPVQNAATALALCEQLPWAISQDTLTKALREMTLVGRFQRLTPTQRASLFAHVGASQCEQIYLDVGHNPHAARYLAQKVRSLKTDDVRVFGVLGMLQDKDALHVAQPLAGLIDQWFCCSLDGARGQSAVTLRDKIAAALPNADIRCFDSVQAGTKAALQTARKQDIVLIFGSFHTVAAIVALFSAKNA
ncbi:bifunctional tetrahydrofolate synthase/dihydrofolate synthase [Pasteurellaceae bacterium HPA106]|uniref:bifunctional tetrahydrofolate synthase/dihydrofolate synthase n=1 Tax=Spirabiliibacterium pneumoniae TaxID=221400 RepID=UPI001AACE76D|nr:bifunctional tetrahydrofolate synthase/dihydrofolate synthase [Spirabiliibacterium pneumoniae]MBE2896541.1 bifunctional tetrahydrofolate synthase/dihydrofolate synthase [Spirabiliibacterium pneumoniae]